MLVDLGRNDLSRVCRAGSVHVARFMEPERFSHITHLVSEVAGELRDGRDARSTCCARRSRPAPSRARRRCARCRSSASSRATAAGPYAGAVLYALPGGPLDACIAIRTVVLHDGLVLLQAGAGIVADSDPTAEHEECLRKLAALEAAIDLAEAGG